jgi:hypothetical protein
MSQSDTTVSDLKQRLEHLPSSDDIDDLTDAVEDLSKQIAASQGTDIDRDEVVEISREQTMQVVEHLVSAEDCESDRCVAWQQDLISLANRRGVPESGEAEPDVDGTEGDGEKRESQQKQEQGEEESEGEQVEEVETNDGAIFG